MEKELDEEDCVEIYYALDSRIKMILRGECNTIEPIEGKSDDGAQLWAEHLGQILEKIGPEGRFLTRFFKMVEWDQTTGPPIVIN